MLATAALENVIDPEISVNRWILGIRWTAGIGMRVKRFICGEGGCRTYLSKCLSVAGFGRVRFLGLLKVPVSNAGNAVGGEADCRFKPMRFSWSLFRR